MKNRFIHTIVCPLLLCCIHLAADAYNLPASDPRLVKKNPGKNLAVTSAGYIKPTSSGGSYQACSEAASSVTMQVYSAGGTITVGSVLYTDAAGTQVLNGNYSWFAYSTTYAGAVTTTLHVWPDGNIHENVACTGGTGGGGGGGTTGGWSISTNVGANGGYKIKPAIIRDLSGYAIRDRSKPAMFFDGFNEVDPANGVLDFIGTAGATYGLPHQQDAKYYPQGNVIGQGGSTVYYPGNRGVRIIFDMTGARDMNDTTKKVKFTSIYAAEDYTDAGDTLYFYNFDKVFRASPSQRWWYMARPDSLLTPFLKVVGSGATRTWKSYAVSDSMRYVMVRAVLRDRGNYKTAPGITELMIYGKRLYDSTTLDKRPDVYTGALPNKKKASQTFDKSVGTNLGQGFDTLQLQYDGLIRIYGGKNYWATQTTTATAGSEQYKFDNFNDIGPKQYAAFKRAGTKFWWSIRGESAWYGSKYGAARIDIDNYGIEPEVPFSYKREADFYYNYAAKFGTVAVPAGNTRWTGDAGYPNGLGLISYVEAGNEDELSVSPLTSDAHTAACYDGAQGNLGLGGRTGVKSADPNFKLIYPGTSEQDSQRVDNYVWLSKITRTDNKVAVDAFNFHRYLRNTNNLNREFLCSDFVGAHGESAEKDSTLLNNTAFAKAVFNYCDSDTTKEIFNTENGLGNWGHETYDELYACNVVYDIGNMGKITLPGLDSLQSKAVLMSRFEMITNASPIQGYNEYFFHNSNYGPNNFPLFSSYGRITGRDTTTYRAQVFYPWWYYRAGLYSSLKGYYPDSILSSAGTGLWIIRFRNVTTPDSVCYAVWKGSYDGSSLANQVINVGNITGSALKKTMSFTSIIPSASPVTIVNNSITVTAAEIPSLYFIREKSTIVLQPPVVNAGADINIVLPTSSVTTSGTATAGPGAAIASYLWTKLSGPASYAIASNTSPVTGISSLSQGTYSFQLSATDNNGMTAADTMLVIVAPAPINIAPTANAGPDIITNTSSAAISGTASDADGSIASYLWTKISGPSAGTLNNANTATLGLSGLVNGTYSFQLQVTDNQGATGKDSVNVTVNIVVSNQPPVAVAGADITITTNSVLLNAWGTNDPDGSIASYQWTKIAGPSSCTITNGIYSTPTMSNLITGVYSFRLMVTDNLGATGSDTINVTVNLPGSNIPPVANAGADISITLPANTVTLSGSGSSDPDGTIAGYAWSKISGPSQFSISGANTVNASVSNLAQGTYAFQLTATDNSGAPTSDTVLVIVNAAGTNKAPVAAAGPDVSITTSSVLLNAWASNDPDGSIVSYQWTKIAGPATYSIANGIYSTPTMSNLMTGVYSFRLVVTDNLGATGSDTINVTVNLPTGAASNGSTVSIAGTDNSAILVSSCKLYPNPVVGNILAVEMVNTYKGNLLVSVCDVNGKVLKRIKWVKPSDVFTGNILLPQVNPGTYLVSIQPEGNLQPVIYKIIRQ